MSYNKEENNIYTETNLCSEPYANHYEDLRQVSSLNQPVVATRNEKASRKFTYSICFLAVGCILNFILIVLMASCLAYFLANNIATKSEVDSISQKQQAFNLTAGQKGLSGAPGPEGQPGIPGLFGNVLFSLFKITAKINKSCMVLYDISVECFFGA